MLIVVVTLLLLVASVGATKGRRERRRELHRLRRDRRHHRSESEVECTGVLEWWQDRPSNGYLAEGPHDATAGTDLGRLCDDRADGLCAAGRAGVSAPTPLSLAGQGRV